MCDKTNSLQRSSVGCCPLSSDCQFSLFRRYIHRFNVTY